MKVFWNLLVGGGIVTFVYFLAGGYSAIVIAGILVVGLWKMSRAKPPASVSSGDPVARP